MIHLRQHRKSVASKAQRQTLNKHCKSLRGSWKKKHSHLKEENKLAETDPQKKAVRTKPTQETSARN